MASLFARWPQYWWDNWWSPGGPSSFGAHHSWHLLRLQKGLLCKQQREWGKVSWDSKCSYTKSLSPQLAWSSLKGARNWWIKCILVPDLYIFLPSSLPKTTGQPSSWSIQFPSVNPAPCQRFICLRENFGMAPLVLTTKTRQRSDSRALKSSYFTQERGTSTIK